MKRWAHVMTVVVIGPRGPVAYEAVPYSKARRAELRRMVANDPRPATLYETYGHNSWVSLRNRAAREAGA